MAQRKASPSLVDRLRRRLDPRLADDRRARRRPGRRAARFGDAEYLTTEAQQQRREDDGPRR